MYYRNRNGVKIRALQKKNKFGGLITFKRKGIVNFNFSIPEGEFDSVVIMPSSKKLVANFANRINRLSGIKVSDFDTLVKNGRISKIPVNLRHKKSAEMFQSKRVAGKILLVDDYSITGASMVCAAKKLLENGAESVTGFCIVVSR